MTLRVRLIIDMECVGRAEGSAARDRVWDSLRHLEGVEHLTITEVPGPEPTPPEIKSGGLTTVEINEAILGTDVKG
ncbi:hypothetical protein LCGC14_1617990, partial [marine sediment metagenome]